MDNTAQIYADDQVSGTRVDGMTQTKHAKRRAEGLIAAWLCLIIAGAATVTFNIVNAWRSGMPSPLGWVEGVVPVALAMAVSHLVATCRAGRFLKTVTFLVMIGALALSVRATGAVVAPAAGQLRWLWGAVTDTAALVALQLLLSIKARAAAQAERRAEAEAAASDERTALRAQLEAERAALEPLRDELAKVREDLAEAVANAETLTRKLEAARPRKRPRKPAPQKTAAGTRSKPAEQPAGDPAADPATEVPQDFDAQARALAVIAAEPDISGAKLAERVGMSERWGQTFKKNLAAAAPADPQARSEP